jgi:HEAT repeat protein
VLADAEDRTTRRKLLDRLAQAPVDLGPLIVARLDDERWFVQRNMLVLLHRVARTPPGFSAAAWLAHSHSQVRQEAVRLQLALPSEREDTLRTALEDDDWRIVRIGLSALQESCPSAMVPGVVRCSQDPNIPEQVRLLALAALGRARDRDALSALLRVVDGGTTILGRPRLAAKTPMFLAALQALADGWQDDPQARPRLLMAANSPDPIVRRAAQRRT